MINRWLVLYSFIIGFFNAKLGALYTRKYLKKVQKSRFNRLIKKYLIKSPYYSRFDSNQLEGFPVINKKIHVDNFNQINTQGLDRDDALSIAIKSESSRDFEPKYRGFSVGLSSGTSGNRGLFVTSDRERAEWAGYIMGKMLPFSTKRHRVAFFLRANNNLYESANGLLVDFRFFDLIDGVKPHISDLEKFDPTLLIAPASVLKKIADEKPLISPDKIISVAEVLESSEALYLENYFNKKIDQVYQCTEGFIAATCKQGNLHLNEDILIIEKDWVDRDTGRFSPIITDTKRITQPVIRYLLDDILVTDDTPCSCGSPFTRIKAIEGRMDDIIILRTKSGKPVDIFPDFIRNTIVASCDELQEYQVLQVSPDTLEVYIAPFTDSIKKQISAALDILLERWSITSVQYDFCQYIEAPSHNKRRRVMRCIDA